MAEEKSTEQEYKTLTVDSCGFYRYVIRIDAEHVGLNKKINSLTVNLIKNLMEIFRRILNNPHVEKYKKTTHIMYYLYTFGLDCLMSGEQLRILGYVEEAGENMVYRVGEFGNLEPLSQDVMNLVKAHGARFWANHALTVYNVINFYNIYKNICHLSYVQLNCITNEDYEKITYYNREETEALLIPYQFE